MAAGEARAVWQRKVSRYLVQEDAKRAPKFTSSHSSSSSSTKQVQEDSVSSPPSVVHPQNQSPCAPFMPLFQPNQRAQVKTPMEAGLINMNWEQSLSRLKAFKNESSEKHFDPTSPWNPLSSEKAGPWWRTTDKDEIASLVAQRSLHFVENCDLPTPQKMKRSYYHGSSPHEHWPSSRKKRTEEASSESDLSKSELLEALRRSQTRAREAENMAKEACAEKA
ncbi:PREDICTED: uncharacterized protein LOC106308842 [Brassica oleracea var. oleracea]|uniref:uncharacterized protein LOC106308842 n=1 Tax=Brassica oleracea var. oleracea TaxID=109376 RepID=UPI0006A74F46|nr:PREDICTED: uncharacterized protein LOC106308842 [Brassica oleracea var. oleracea]